MHAGSAEFTHDSGRFDVFMHSLLLPHHLVRLGVQGTGAFRLKNSVVRDPADFRVPDRLNSYLSNALIPLLYLMGRGLPAHMEKHLIKKKTLSLAQLMTRSFA
jgi:hypothetical protein